MSIGSWIRFLTLAAMWGCSFAFIKVSLDAFRPEQVAFYRVVVGGLVLAALVAATRTALPRPSLWGHVLVAAVFGNVLPFLLFAIGEQTTTAAVAGVVQGATPLVTLTLATAAIPQERATRWKLIGMVAGFAGLVIVVAPWAANGGLNTIAGQLACVGAAASYAVAFVYIRRFIAPHKVPALGLTCSQLAVSTAILAVVVSLRTGLMPVTTPSAATIVSLLVLGGASTGAAFVLLNRLIADEGATTASTVNYLVPVFSVLVGAAALGEHIGWNLPVGGALVVLGLAIAEGRRIALRRRGTDSPAAPSSDGPSKKPVDERPLTTANRT